MIIELIKSAVNKVFDRKTVANSNNDSSSNTPVSSWSFEKSTIKRFSIQKIYDEARI
jgi:hypothetical protein